MLTAFRAQPIVELKQRDKSKIECVLAYGDRVLVGLNTGSLRIYRVNEPLTPAPNGTATDSADKSEPGKPAQRPTDLLHEEEKFSRRAVQQLAVIKEANVLVTLTDSYVSVHDLQTYALQEKLEKTRGASAFAVTSNVEKDPETDVPSLASRLAVAVKRKVLVWSWHDMELDPDVRELVLPATVKSLTWITGSKILVGMDPGYTMMNIDSDETFDINKPVVAAEAAGQTTARFGAVTSSGMGYMGMGGWVPKPMAARLANGTIMLAKDVNTLFIDEHGKPLEKRQIPWAQAPDAIGYSYPYLLSLQPAAKGALDIRSPETLTLLQTIPVPNASMLHVPQPNISLAHAGKGFLVSSDRVIWRMHATGYEAQTADLVKQMRFDEAISLLGMLEDTLLKDKQGQIREIQIKKAQSLFTERKFQPALDLFTDASAPPARVIALYPKSIAGDLSSVDDSEIAKSDVDGASESKEESAKTKPVELAEPASPATPRKSKAEKIKTAAKDSDAASVVSVAQAADRTPDSQSKPNAVLDGLELKQAVRALCSFLAQSRVQIQRYLTFDGTLKDAVAAQLADPEAEIPFRNLILVTNEQGSKVDWEKELYYVARLVDTTLFRAYMFALPSLAGPLFRLDNFCDADVVEERLYQSGRYNDLIDFLQGKKLHRQALELLEQFGQNKAEDEVMPALRGPVRTVGYLQQLPPELIDMILEFSKWPLESSPEMGMDIFLADTDNAERLPRDRVLAHLEAINPDLSLRYLEHIINELDEGSPDFHQKLVDSYISKIKSSPTDAASYQAKLEAHLRKSTSYNKSKTFRQLPSDSSPFFEPRAIVLRAMGNHKQALSIYVFQLKDYAKAEAYCNEIYLETSTPRSRALSGARKPSFTPPPPSSFSTSPEPDNVYTILLALYLKPPQGEQRNWAPALALLSHHGPRLPASSTLDLVPDDLAVKELQAYFRGRMRQEITALNEMRIVRGLEEVRRVRTEGELQFGTEEGRKGGRSRRVVVGEDGHCKVCLKRFGNSAIRVWPDGEVVHYGCVGRKKGGGGFEGMARGSWG
ncbi:hypothetical protein CAC42_4897 [Sphaceloma murrayae]|uniref:CNH domain-containing protein n=1 Tax=Sphaceloma murrayae TaxID=2082308 RepID=A0A2K1QPY8_9PEZI|nr:hypothetical protein CAC42_4897 [Sphaceloma murrayae]